MSYFEAGWSFVFTCKKCLYKSEPLRRLPDTCPSCGHPADCEKVYGEKCDECSRYESGSTRKKRRP